MNNKGRLLVRDDEQDVGVLICGIAQRVNYEAIAQTDPEVFFEHIQSWQPSHVIVNLQMPGVDGVETLNRLSRLDCDCTVIVTSGLGSRVQEVAARAAAENGLNVGGILPKPFTPSRLRALLKTPIDGGSGECARIRRAGTMSVADLERALEHRQLDVFFQPKVSCKTGGIVGVESLARWFHPDKGAIPPDTVIPLAEAARQRCPGLRVLFTSGYTENAIVHHGRLDRGVELLSKPYRRDQLAAKIRKVLVGAH